MRRATALGLTAALLTALLPLVAPAVSHAQLDPEQTPLAMPAREVEPVVMEGSQFPSWSRLPAQGVGRPYPSGARPGANIPAIPPGGDSVRDAHNGDLHVPPDDRDGVPVDQVVAYRWDDGEGFVEIPVQVDERFPYFLANGPSGFSDYSGTDMELTYAWDVESWKKMFGDCRTDPDDRFARYAKTVEEVEDALDLGPSAQGGIPPLGESTLEDLEQMLAAKFDPVATLDDDEIVFMASDAGARAPEGIGPEGTIGEERQEIRLVDPRDPSQERFVYLFLKEEGSSFTADSGYVDYERDENADEWVDRDTFHETDPEKLGSSNTRYGPNLRGAVCNHWNGSTDWRESNDRFSRDGVTVSTDTYQWYASGRWMVRDMRITKPETTRDYGPDLIDRWKGRAFQQSPDSSISLVGFEDEQVNWEANAVLLGERAGPVRAIRETWGADSGTNVTKTESFYRDAVHYRYRVRVHPIPPDGLYTSWDYNHEVAERYYNESFHADDDGIPSFEAGVPIDGINDDVGNIDEVAGQPVFFDAPDPTFTKPLAIFNWEQVSGRDDSGSLVYMFEFRNAHSFQNPAVVPYYRDDACFDDGTGDDPRPRPWPGRASTHPDVYPEQEEGYECIPEDPSTWQHRQGCFGCHGVHYFFTGDTDNATVSSAAVNEIDGAQWQWAVPTSEPVNVGDRYANTVKTPLVASATPQASEPQDPDPSPSPSPTEDPSPSPDPTESPSPDPTESPSPDPTESPSPDPTESPSPAGEPDPTETSREQLVQRGPCRGLGHGSRQANPDDPSGVGEIIVGTPGDDVLVGTPGDDIICGLAGDDALRGVRGNDRLVGGPGNDELRGGRGHDELRGGAGHDVLRGGPGRDVLRGGPGRDALSGGRGSDRLFGGPGSDRLFGGLRPGRNVLHGGRGFDRCRGRSNSVFHRSCNRQVTTR